MSQFQRYKPFPALEDLDPGIEAGWDFDFLALRAEPDDKVGSIIISDLTKDQEAAASTRWMIVDISPTAFMSQDWERALAEGRTTKRRPFDPGDVVLTKRYPPGQDFVGNDGRTYRLLKDKEVLAKLKAGANVQVVAEKRAA